MGPLGFQVIINDAASNADTNVWKYVDDLAFDSNTSNLAKSTLQEDLDNNLTRNPIKSQGLQVCFMQNPSTPTLSIDDVPLNFVNCTKILGI